MRLVKQLCKKNLFTIAHWSLHCISTAVMVLPLMKDIKNHLIALRNKLGTLENCWSQLRPKPSCPKDKNDLNQSFGC